MEIQKNDILSDLVFQNFEILKVLERFGIKLGFGQQTLEQVCKTQEINADLLCLILNIFTDKNYTFEIKEEFEYIPQVLLYLKNSHAYFLGEKIPKIEKDITKLLKTIEEPNASLINNFFEEYKQEVKEHMGHENQIVFKYITSMHKKYADNDSSKWNPSFSIAEYETTHEDIEQVLLDLKNLLIRHLPQTSSDYMRTKVLINLFELEDELHSHQIIEDDLLTPLARRMESIIESRKASAHG